jgi:hypothetical protein
MAFIHLFLGLESGWLRATEGVRKSNARPDVLPRGSVMRSITGLHHLYLLVLLDTFGDDLFRQAGGDPSAGKPFNYMALRNNFPVYGYISRLNVPG